MLRILTALLIMCTTTCQPVSNVHRLSTKELLDNYSSYVHKEVILIVKPNSYSCANNRIELYTGLPNAKPVILLYNINCSGNENKMFVRGIVKEVIEDGIDRGQGYDLCIVLVHCKVISVVQE